MLIIKTIVHETIWGGNKLTRYTDSLSKKIGHLYSLISNGEFESEILNGEYKGQLFRKYFDENKKRLHLENYKEMPYVLAIVDASDDLSIQVHPDDAIAKELENTDYGKNESWYFIQAPETGKIYAGCKVRTKEELIEKIKLNKFNEIYDYLDIEKDDYVYIEAGTLHAMSKGSLVFEIEENCNATYRIYDFDRADKNGNKRNLQLREAVKAVEVSKKPVAQKYTNKKIERFYTTQLFKNTGKYTNESNTIECLTIIKGETQIQEYSLKMGTTIVLEPKETVNLNPSDFIVSSPVIKGDKLCQ